MPGGGDVTDSELYQRVRRFLIAEIELFGTGADGARVFRAGELIASINSCAPDRSLFNWAFSEHPEALLAGYAELARAYREAGVRAFGVWVDRDDERMETELAARGHNLDGRPRAMGAVIDDLALDEPGDLEWEQTSDIPLIARINDAAYDFPPPAFSAALTRASSPRFRAYVALLGGEPVSCLMTHDSEEGDCGITAVATLPAARGARLVSRLLTAALRSARSRGARTTTLQASTKGAPVYARLGYRDLGAMSVWEPRVPRPA